MNDNNILHLVLKKQWYDLIENGIKKEEYREIKPYWSKRLLPKDFNIVCFHFGYTNTKMTFQIKSITVDTGKEEWGAEKDKLYFVIKLGDRLS